MIKLINEYLGINKFEAILVTILLIGLVLMFKDNVTTLVSDLLFSEFDGLVNQILNN